MKNGEVFMEEFCWSLPDFYERQAERLMKVAGKCRDADTQQELIAIASGYRERLGQLLGERPVQHPEGTAIICGWRH